MPSLNQCKTDVGLEKNGRWVQFGEPEVNRVSDGEGNETVIETFIELLIARMGNPAYEKRLGTLKRSDAKKIMRGKNIDTTMLEPMVKEAMANCVLLGWRNLNDENGEEIVYSPEKALQLFNDPSLREFYEFVRDESQDDEAYRLEVKEDQAKN